MSRAHKQDAGPHLWNNDNHMKAGCEDNEEERLRRKANLPCRFPLVTQRETLTPSRGQVVVVTVVLQTASAPAVLEMALCCS